MDDLRKEIIEDELKVNKIKSIVYFLDGKGKKRGATSLQKSNTTLYQTDLPKYPIENIRNEKGVHDCTEEELKVWRKI